MLHMRHKESGLKEDFVHRGFCTKPSLQRADADFLDLRLEQADDSASVRRSNEDIQGDSLWFRKLCQLTKIIQFDAYNMYLYQAVCVCVCVTSRLSSQLLRFPRGLEDLKTIFVPESSASEAEPSKPHIYSSQLVTLRKKSHC